MRYVSLKNSKTLATLALAASASSCSLKSNGPQQIVTIALPGARVSLLEKFEKMTDWISLAWADATTPANLSSDPSSLSDFDCFGVNVSGPGIDPDPGVVCSDPVDAPAIIGGFVPRGDATIDLPVPAGPDRHIKIFGVRSLAGCPNLHDIIHDGAFNFNNLGHFYDIGGVHTDIFADTTVNVHVTYDSTSPVRTFSQCHRNGDSGGTHLWSAFAGTGPGSVYASKSLNGIAYVGGSFDYIGPTTQSGTIISQGTGAPQTLNNTHISGTVRCAVRDGTGGYFVGGSFNHVESTSYATPAGLIHVKADGSWDPSFVVHVDAGKNVFACKYDGANLILGGDFATLSINSNAAISANALASIPVAAPSVINLGASISGSTPVVYSISLDLVLNRLYAVGSFTLTGALSGHSNAIAFSTSLGFTVDATWHPDPNAAANVVFADNATGKVYLGGAFTNTTYPYLFRVSSAGSVDTGWNPGLAGTAYDIAKDSSFIYAAARDSGNVPQVYRIDPSTGTSTSILSASGTPDSFNTLAFSTDGNQLLLVGGKFLISGHQNVISISSPATSPTVNPTFYANTNAGTFVNVIAPNALGAAYVGGTFTSIGGVLRNNLAALDLGSGEATSWAPTGTVGQVHVIETDGTSIYAGYDSDSTHSVYAGVLKIGQDSVVPNGWPKSTSSVSTDKMRSLALSGNFLYCGGTFTSLGGTPSLTNVARIDLTTNATDGTWNPVIGTTSNVVNSVIAVGSQVFIGGNFTTFSGGTTIAGLISMNASSPSLSTGWTNPGISYGVQSATYVAPGTSAFAPGGGLIVGTQTSPSGPAQLKLVNLSSGGEVSWPSAPALSTLMNQTTQLVQSGGTLYIAGQAIGTTGKALVAYDLNNQVLESSFLPGIQNSNTASSVEVLTGGKLMVTGSFQQVNVAPADGTGGKMAWGMGAFDATSGILY